MGEKSKVLKSGRPSAALVLACGRRSNVTIALNYLVAMAPHDQSQQWEVTPVRQNGGLASRPFHFSSTFRSQDAQ